MKKKVTYIWFILVLIILQGCGKAEISVKHVKIELGGTVSENILDYISVEGRKPEKVVSDAELDTSKIDPMAVGEYQAVIRYEGREIAVPVIVEDTTPPTIRATDTVFVEGDQMDVDDVAKADDLSGVESLKQLKEDDQNVGIIIDADNPIILEAVDPYGNKTVKEIWPNVIKDDGNLPRGRYVNSFFWFPYFEEDPVSEDVYTDIKEAYSDMEWSSEFERGNVGSYDSYKEIFRGLVDNKRTYYNPRTGENLFLKDYLGTEDYSDFPHLKFYFFDMDQDGYPELCLKDMRFLLIFKYDSEQDMFLLWTNYMENSYFSLMGSRTVLYDRFETSQTFYKLDEYGRIIYSVNFEERWYGEEGEEETRTAYFVSLPEYEEEDRQIEITDEMKQYGYVYYYTGTYYFRVTEEQYNELTEEFYQAKQLAEREIEKVTYTYEELFGE